MKLSSDEERERLNTLIHKGKHRAGQLVKARILVEGGRSGPRPWRSGWSDSQIAAALDISIGTVASDPPATSGGRASEAVLKPRKHLRQRRAQRIFDAGAAEAKLEVAVACSKPPTGRARWTLKLLEEAVVETEHR